VGFFFFKNADPTYDMQNYYHCYVTYIICFCYCSDLVFMYAVRGIATSYAVLLKFVQAEVDGQC
jgi:hypothetical protein